MKQFIKANWKYILFFTVIGTVGGYFTGLYLADSYPPEIREQISAQGITDGMLGLISAIQSALYGLILGSFGIFFASKIGLWKEDKSITKKPMLLSLVVAVIGGTVMILSDILFFGKYEPALMDSYASKPSIPYLITTVTYGAVIEEVMMRLFFLSLIAFLLYKLFGRKKQDIPASFTVIANIISAFLFAAGHLPVTGALFGLTPMLIFRCFLLNGGIGLLFGYLYRKYGLRYAMLAHGGCHIISKLIWIAFM